MKAKIILVLVCIMVVAGCALSGCMRDTGSTTDDTGRDNEESSATDDTGSISNETNKQKTKNQKTKKSKLQKAEKSEKQNVKKLKDQKVKDQKAEEALLSSAEDISLKDVDGSGHRYTFKYGGKRFRVGYSKDNWTIFDSYKINNEDDMKIICTALIDIHPVHGSDLKSYRTADDMAYEWLQHNIAYVYLPKDSPWRDDAKNVDLDPADQGRTFKEIYEDRTGEKFY